MFTRSADRPDGNAAQATPETTARAVSFPIPLRMNLERASVDVGNVWTAVSESFECGLDQPTERSLYASAGGPPPDTGRALAASPGALVRRDDGRGF